MTTPPEIFEPPDWQDREEEVLAPYAMKTRLSRGRRYPEDPHPYRTLYQRDRDRVVHSTAFRRLMYKTQVLVTATNDHHRTRLTHTLEVAQISRTIARQLGLNEDLTEAIALLHDLGHPPFGHAGEEILDECMKNHGGFDHNRHGLRIVEMLENRYADFPGLNLSWEVLEAQAWHSKNRQAPEIQPFISLGQPLLESQVVDVTDSLAYDMHDIDDALWAGIISLEDLQKAEVWRCGVERVRRRHPGLRSEHIQATVVRDLIDWQVTDLLENTRHRIKEERIRSVEDVRKVSRPLVRPGPEVQTLKAELEDFLHKLVYGHHRVMRMAAKGRRFVKALFQEFCRQPGLLRDRYALQAQTGSLERAVCDYIAGMTDRYALDEYRSLFQPNNGV